MNNKNNSSSKPIAHIKNDGNKAQYLSDHLENTAELCSNFCNIFGLEKLGYIVGLLHDAGKASDAFQKKIKNSALKDDVANNAKVDHSTAGAQFLYKKYGDFGFILSYIIAGHHGGLPNGSDETESNLKKRLSKNVKDYSFIKDWLNEKLPQKIDPKDFLPLNSTNLTHQDIYFIIKMLYSALTDADFLDTEAFMTPENSDRRVNKTDIRKIESHFFNHLEKLIDNAEQTEVNLERKRILDRCIEAAPLQPGIFSLTVPTGGGKTLSSMAFALKHAVLYNKKRVIYVIPYTTIIEQNAQVFHNIFNSLDTNNVLEHHSNISPERETIFNRLSSQNWDAPIIVTTNVQFFESFYNNRSSANRKLHNIANSVIIFDEAQMLPTEFLAPAAAVINELADNFSCSAVICTATQPVLDRKDILKEPLKNIREIIPDTKTLYKKFKRVNTHYQKEKQSLEDIAQKISKYKQVLTIVNTRKDARELAENAAMIRGYENLFHLSTLMVPHHRKKVLNTVKENLKTSNECIVISTQLIEAGVDVDFPVVYRAIAGLDSIAQAAGRCNREGSLESGKVVIFNTDKQPPAGYLRRAADSGKLVLNLFPDDSLNIEAVKRYFEDFYGKERFAHNFDKKDILKKCRMRPDDIPFKEISKSFKLISHKSYSLIVPYNEEGKKLTDNLVSCRYKVVPGELRRALYQYTLQLRENELIKLGNVVEDIFGDREFFLLRNLDIYDDFLGLKPENPDFLNIESTII